MESVNSNSQKKELHQLQQMQDNAKESCMTSFQLLHSFLQVLSYDESKSKRVSERALITLFGQDNETFTSTLNLSAGIALQTTTIASVEQPLQATFLKEKKVSPTPYVPPSKKDYEILFPPRAISLDPVVVAAQELLIQASSLHR
ncbi:hypothetical protein Tco_0617442 [Tanacetum coccineum]